MSKLGSLTHELRQKHKLDEGRRSTIFALERAYLEDNPKCERCGNKKSLSYDHIVPKCILTAFNIDPTKEFWEENSQTLCVACNQQKAHFLDLSNPKTKILLKELLKR